MTLTMQRKDRAGYMELIEQFPLVSINNKSQLKAAIKRIDDLLTKNLDRGGEIYLDALSTLVERYEDEHCSIDAPSDAAMLQHLMDAKGQTATEVAKGSGVAKSAISMVLSGERPFSKNMIAKLGIYFDVSKAVLSANIG